MGRPSALGLSYEANIEPNLALLQRRLDLSEAELKNIVLQAPTVLGLSYVKNLEPKLAFLQEELQFSNETLREKIVKIPALLGYSLEKRYRPRVKQCRQACQPLRLVVERANMTNEKFEQLLAKRQKRDNKQTNRLPRTYHRA